MFKTVDHQAIIDAENLQLIEVLPEPEFQEMHLPNAESIPLTKLDREAVQHLNPDRPTVVYCWDAY